MRAYVQVEISPSLLPALMPLLARLRRLFDLNAESSAVDAHLEAGGLALHVRARPGLRVPGAFDGFEVVTMALLLGSSPSRGAAHEVARLVVRALGDPLDADDPSLDRLAPTAERVADAGAPVLEGLGVPAPRARALEAVARAVADGSLRLEPGGDVVASRRTLVETCGLGERLATSVVMRGLCWPDAFPTSDPALQRAAGASGAAALRALAERWRPWRSYAALHLRYHSPSVARR